MFTEAIRPWTWMGPIAGWLLLGFHGSSGAWLAVMILVLLVSVLAAVHHAEVVAHRVGEPYGTLVLAVAVTIIEVSLIVALIIVSDGKALALARDTVFAAVMIILTGIVGLCLLVGGVRHHEQAFVRHGVNAALGVLAALAVLTLILPNYTTSAFGPVYSPSQLVMVAIVSLVLYAVFVLIQTVSHRDYFLPQGAAALDEEVHAALPSARTAIASAVLLLVALGAVVLLAKALAPSIERMVVSAGAPKAVVGVLIALVVLLPEGFAAVRAARANRLQTSLNLALGSALASIALTIPAVAIVALLNGWALILGIDGKSTVLLALSLFVASLSLSTGRTTVLQGSVLLVIFAIYLFTTIVP